MISANQLYKQSNSEMSFKEWLKDTQRKGILQDHEKMYNMIDGQYDGEGYEEDSNDLTKYTKKSSTTQDSKSKLGFVNIVGIIA